MLNAVFGFIGMAFFLCLAVWQQQKVVTAIEMDANPTRPRILSLLSILFAIACIIVMNYAVITSLSAAVAQP
jgi:hypothetical protein